MLRPIPLRAASRSRLFPSPANFDSFALYAATTVVLLFAAYRLLSLEEVSSAVPFGVRRPLTLIDSLTIVLSLEGLLLVWLWVEMPRRRKAEIALKRMHGVQQAISKASGRIVAMKPEELEEGLQREMSAVREMLGVDRVSWLQQREDGSQSVRMQTLRSRKDSTDNAFETNETRWIASAVLQGSPIHVRRLRDLPPELINSRMVLERNGIKALALIPAGGGTGSANALVLTSFTKEIDWQQEVIAQLSVLASVFAHAEARKAAQDAGNASERKFRHLFEDSPIGIALLDTNGKVRMANPALGRLLGYSCDELDLKNILDLTCPDDMPQTWLQMQELLAGVREITQTENRFRRKHGSMIWGRMTISVAGTRTGERPFLLGMIEDVTETNHAREQLERSRRMLALALESSRTTAWEYDAHSDTISWLDRKKLRDDEEQRPDTASFASVLSHVRPEDRGALRGLANDILRKGGVFSTEFRMIAKDGSDRWMLGKGELLKRAEDAAPKIVGVTVDVSEVKRAQFQLQQLAKRLMEAQEDERKRISRELHDDIGQRVALLAIELDLVHQKLPHEDTLRERVERIRTAASELGADLHQLSHALHGPKLKNLGLEAALGELCNRIASAQSLTVELNCGEPRMIPEEQALVLFRVAQEATSNIIRHSRATKANVTLAYAATHATLTISDNGNGFDPTAGSRGIGLVGMRERLRAVGGELQVFSATGAGSEIQAIVPLHAGATRQFSAGSPQ